MADKPKIAWFTNTESGDVFAINEGTPVHKRVSSNKALYEPTSAPKPKRASKGEDEQGGG